MTALGNESASEENIKIQLSFVLAHFVCQAIFEGLDFPNSRTATRENCGNRDCFIGPSFLQSYSSCVNSWIVYSETRQIGPLFQIDMPL